MSTISQPVAKKRSLCVRDMRGLAGISGGPARTDREASSSAEGFGTAGMESKKSTITEGPIV
jgi:hypothetical protein